MGLEDIEKEIRELSDLLNLYQHAYYVEGRSLVSDLEYDRLYDRLVLLEKECPDLKQPDSPTLRVGSDLSNDFPEVAHSIPVLSLDKAYSIGEIEGWIAKNTARNTGKSSYVVEEKIDGASIVLYYENGILARGVTRGNGFVGNDITPNVKTIRSIPLRLSQNVDITVRGEIFLPLESFESINSVMDIPYANPRNLAAGTLRRQKSSEVARVPLDIFVYEGFFDSGNLSHMEILEYLKTLGFKVSPRIKVFDSKGTGIASYIEELTSQRKSLPYEIDGLVIKVNEMDVREELGYTGHHPRWAIAYKFESPEGETTVKNIDVQVGRTGRITPVARVEEVSIGGSTIQNVTLHNQDYIDLLEVSVGDKISVSRRGDVIPAVERVLEKNEEGNPVWKIPEVCPSCGTLLQKKGAHHFCTNPLCPAQVRGRVYHFIGRNQMDIENFGPETVDFLLAKGYIRGIADIYTFDYDKLVTEPGFGEKKIKLIKEGIEKSKSRPFRRVLASLGIPEVGKKAAELLIQSGFRDIDSLLKLAERGDDNALTSIRGIGRKTAKTIISEFSKPEVISLIDGLKDAGLNFREEETPLEDGNSMVFADQVWCVTGSFNNFKPRSLAEEEITRRGGRTVTSVTGKTTHLLAGLGAGSKLEKAVKLGIPVIHEDEFIKMLAGGRNLEADFEG